MATRKSCDHESHIRRRLAHVIHLPFGEPVETESPHQEKMVKRLSEKPPLAQGLSHVDFFRICSFSGILVENPLSLTEIHPSAPSSHPPHRGLVDFHFENRAQVSRPEIENALWSATIN